MIQGVAGVIIWTDNLERLSSFYRGTLGFTPHSVRPDWVAFSFGEVRLSLGVHSQVAGPARDPHRVMVNLAVDDILAVTQRLVKGGVVFTRLPEQESWGGWVATFQDPDGNMLQLLQQPEAGLA